MVESSHIRRVYHGGADVEFGATWEEAAFLI
jgi:hypothetical protein